MTVIAGTESGKPAASAAQRAMSPIPSWAGLTQPGGDVLDALERDADPLARRDHRLPEQVVAVLGTSDSATVAVYCASTAPTAAAWGSV